MFFSLLSTSLSTLINLPVFTLYLPIYTIDFACLSPLSLKYSLSLGGRGSGGVEMQGGFSIREYASRMRSVNVVKCWPFDETFGEETVKSLLPPIVVKRFTWWFDELQLLHSEAPEKHEKKTKKVFEKGETSSRNADRDLEAAKQGVKLVNNKSLKGKLRATKKRSIVEIFAVAPPVKRATSSEDEEDNTTCNSTSRNVGTNRARRKKSRSKKTKNTSSILRKALRVVKKINRKKAAEKRGGGGDEIGVSKKENCFKVKLHAQDQDTGNLSSSCSKESNKDIHDCVSNSKRKPRLRYLSPYKKFPVRGILKNQSKELSLKQSKKCLLKKKKVQLNGCSSSKANKHVTFSEIDELRLNRKPSQSAECFKLQKDCSSDIGSVDCALAVGKDSTYSESSGSEDASAIIGKEIGAGPASNEQLQTFNVDSTATRKQNYEREYFTRCGSSERSAIYRDHDLRDAPHSTMDVCSGFLHTPRERHEGYYNSQNVKVITTSSNSNCRRLTKEDLGTSCSIFPPLCFEDYLRTHNEASMSQPSNMKRTYTLTQAASENTAINCETFRHLFPNELQTFCSLPDGSISGTNEEFVGLPLNSQGELITLNSSGKREFNPMLNSNAVSMLSNDASNCSGHHQEYWNSDSKTPSRGQLDLFPVESYVKENAMPVIPSRLGIIESQSVNANPDFDFPEINYHPFHSSEKTICRGHNQLQKGPENEKSHSTMRLMGKEFEVGARGVQGFDDRCIWKDKQIIDELHFQTEPSFRELRETLFCPSVNDRSVSKYALPQPDCRTQTSSTYKSVFLSRTVDCPQNYYHTLSPEVYNSKSLFLEPFTSGYESQLFTLELPKVSPPHQKLYSNMSPSAIQLKSNQNLQCSPISAIKFPFMHPDLDGQATPSWARRPSLIQQPFCFDVSENATHFSSALQSMTPAPLTPLPYYPGLLPVQRKLGNQSKIKERMNSRIGIRDLNICKKSKGQLSNAHFKALKRPPLGFQEGLQCAVRNMEDALGSCSTTQTSRFVMSEYDQTNKDVQAQTILPFVDSYFETARTGPIKLTAGSKHIFKAHHQKDQDISLSATNIGFRYS